MMIVPVYIGLWLMTFRLTRGNWRLRSDGGWDSVERNIAIVCANVALIVFNVVVLVAAKLLA